MHPSPFPLASGQETRALLPAATPRSYPALALFRSRESHPRRPPLAFAPPQTPIASRAAPACLPWSSACARSARHKPRTSCRREVPSCVGPGSRSGTSDRIVSGWGRSYDRRRRRRRRPRSRRCYTRPLLSRRSPGEERPGARISGTALATCAAPTLRRQSVSRPAPNAAALARTTSSGRASPQPPRRPVCSARAPASSGPSAARGCRARWRTGAGTPGRSSARGSRGLTNRQTPHLPPSSPSACSALLRALPTTRPHHAAHPPLRSPAGLRWPACMPRRLRPRIPAPAGWSARPASA
mmetsp:Transcript_1038/g.3305  ORF Transcript_1038/g.3305 Transcript_1038/m.3305 type:complete len:298 (-) Transcript_1038:541-1434(-)